MDYSNQLDTYKINIALNQYLSKFNNYWANEKYKWEAVQCFQQNWDIESPDFVGMLDSALAKTENLLSSMNSFPRGMLINFAKAEPEGVRKMFRTLFNEDIDLVRRFYSFVAEAERIRKQYDDGTWHSTALLHQSLLKIKTLSTCSKTCSLQISHYTKTLNCTLQPSIFVFG
jgi:hypothetical protein